MSIPTNWKGSYYDGRALAPQPVSLSVEPTGLTIRFPSATTQFWPYSELQQTQGRYSGEEVRFERGTGLCETVVIPNANILLAIHRISGKEARHFHHPGTRRKRGYWTMAAACAALPIIYGIFTWGVPLLAGPITSAIPVFWERQLGQFVQQTFTDEQDVCENIELHDTLQALLTRLTTPIQDSPYDFQVTLVDSPQVNAMAAPGGYLMVFRGLLQETDTPEELAGVLAHEIQHVLLRHSMRLIVQHVSMAFIIAALSGDASGMLLYGLQAAQTLQTLSYSREAENEADEQGLVLLQHANINPEGMMSFFEKLRSEEHQGEESPFRYFSTHPPTHERQEHLEGLELPHSIPYQKFPFEKNWVTLRDLCEEQSAESRK
jgi:Zn-dependent protease with chaperone function